jgi:hypothetical protein
LYNSGTSKKTERKFIKEDEDELFEDKNELYHKIYEREFLIKPNHVFEVADVFYRPISGAGPVLYVVLKPL